jgi:hypothetical protein
MNAEDDRYARLFLFTEKEVEVLCKAHKRVRSHSHISYLSTVCL